MRVGVYLADFRPDTGGGYTFQEEVVRAFASVAGTSSHQFVLLGGGKKQGGVGSAFGLVYESVGASAWERRRLTLGNYSPLLRRIWSGPGPMERAAGRLGLDCIWYPGGGAYEVTATPYVATVWDLQHRLTPWFPEMTAGGTWEAREAAYRPFLQRASYIITGTRVGREEIGLCYQVPVERVRLLPHPTPAFALEGGAVETGICARMGLGAGYLLYPAQFWPHKNHANLLLALAELGEHHTLRLPLVLVGSDKGNAGYVRATAARLGLADRVTFAGFVTQADLVELYRHAGMLVYASLCGPENLQPLEAMALGCPVVAARVPGAQEQLQDAALLFDPTSPTDIAQKVSLVYRDAELRARRCACGLRRARSWTPDHYAQGMLRLFDDFTALRRCWPSAGSV